MITWIMISNLLEIDFIHSDIHGRFCKKNYLTIPNINRAIVEVWECNVIPLHTLLGMWLLIHAGNKVDPCQWKGPQVSTCQWQIYVK